MKKEQSFATPVDVGWSKQLQVIVSNGNSFDIMEMVRLPVTEKLLFFQ